MAECYKLVKSFIYVSLALTSRWDRARGLIDILRGESVSLNVENPQGPVSLSQQLLCRRENVKLPCRWGRGRAGRWVRKNLSRCRESVLMGFDRVGVWKDQGFEDAFSPRTKRVVMQSAGKGGP